MIMNGKSYLSICLFSVYKSDDALCEMLNKDPQSFTFPPFIYRCNISLTNFMSDSMLHEATEF